MKLGIATDQERASAPKWIVFDMEGYEDNLLEKDPEKQIKFLIAPQTRALINRIEKRVDSIMKARGRSKYDDKDSDDLPQVATDRGDFFTREMAKELVKDWTNIVDLDENPLECNDRNKIWLFEDINIALWVLHKGQGLTNVRIEEEAKNSES